MEVFREFMNVAATLSLRDFLQQFPHPFLFYSDTPGAMEQFVHTRLVDTGHEMQDGAETSVDRFSDQVMDFVPLMPNPHPNKEFPHKAFIGRDERRDFVVSHNTVSNRHACLIWEAAEEVAKLVDSGSTNGSQVRGKPIEPGVPMILRDGDLIMIGKVQFMFFSPRGAYRFMHQYRLFQQALNR